MTTFGYSSPTEWWEAKKVQYPFEIELPSSISPQHNPGKHVSTVLQRGVRTWRFLTREERDAFGKKVWANWSPHPHSEMSAECPYKLDELVTYTYADGSKTVTGVIQCRMLIQGQWYVDLLLEPGKYSDCVPVAKLTRVNATATPPKAYTDVCPCGIHPSQCCYHK